MPATAAGDATPGTPAASGATAAEASAGAGASTAQPPREAPPQRRTPGLLAALLLALGGGLILNLMPCVLPVLSL